MSDQTVLVTGAAGFIGFHVARRSRRRELRAKGANDDFASGIDIIDGYFRPRQARRQSGHEKPDRTSSHNDDPVAWPGFTGPHCVQGRLHIRGEDRAAWGHCLG